MKKAEKCINGNSYRGANGASVRNPPMGTLWLNNPSRDVTAQGQASLLPHYAAAAWGDSPGSQMVVDLTIVIYVKHTVRDAYGPSSIGWGLQGIYTPRSILIYPPMCQSTQAEINQSKGSWSPKG